jgi:hypothetical protein
MNVLSMQRRPRSADGKPRLTRASLLIHHIRKTPRRKGALMEKQQQSIPIELDEKAAEGIYSNFVLTAHTASEFVLDFARMVPGINKAKVFARIIMTPQSAKSLGMVLKNAIEKYEESFGPIQVMAQKGSKGEGSAIGFQTTPPPGQDRRPNKEID